VSLKSATRRVQCSATLTLYGHPGTRSPVIDWYLHELGLEYQFKMPEAAGNPHPFGQVPALSDEGGVEVFESGAILLYLADKYGGLDTPEQRAQVTKWVLWANASLDPVLFKENEQGKVIGTGAAGNPRGLQRLEAVLNDADTDFLVGTEFSVADVAVCAYLLYVPQFFPKVNMGKWPNIAAYMTRCSARPAYEEAYGPRVTSLVREACVRYMETTATNKPTKQSKRFGIF